MILGKMFTTVALLTSLFSTTSLAFEEVTGSSARYSSLLDGDYQLIFHYDLAKISSTSGDIGFSMAVCGDSEDFLCMESDLYNFVFPKAEAPVTRSWIFKGTNYEILSDRNEVYIVGYSVGQKHLNEEYQAILKSSLSDLRGEKEEALKKEKGGNIKDSRDYFEHLSRLIARYECDINGEYIESYIYYSFSYEKGVEAIISIPRIYQGRCVFLNFMPPIALRLVEGDGLLKSR